METITVTSDMVKKTQHYNCLNPIQKKICTTRNNIKNGIEHGVNVVMNVGKDKWEAITKSNHNNKMIVLEIVKKINGQKRI